MVAVTGEAVKAGEAMVCRRMVLGWVCVVLVACLSVACEPRVEEPPLPPTPVRPTAVASVKVGPACVVPLPATPRRTLKPGVDARCPRDIDGRYDLDRTRLTFEPTGVVLAAEIADAPAFRHRGLMFRKQLPDDEGMIFRFATSRIQRFWMKNTCLPLDMLFVDAQGYIVGIEENVPTMNERSYFVRCPSQYVIEVNAGWSRRHGVQPGQRVIFSLNKSDRDPD